MACSKESQADSTVGARAELVARRGLGRGRRRLLTTNHRREAKYQAGHAEPNQTRCNDSISKESLIKLYLCTIVHLFDGVALAASAAAAWAFARATHRSY